MVVSVIAIVTGLAKAAEGSYIVPNEIIEQSQFARHEIDRLRLEINELEEAMLRAPEDEIDI